MIALGVVLKALSIFCLGLIVPGPDFLMVSSTALARGRMEGVKVAAGIAVALVFYMACSLLGLSLLFTHYLWIVMAVKICGGFYLLYLGYMLWRSSFTRLAASERVLVQKKPQKSAFLAGMLTCLTNPKAIAFFGSIFAVVLTPQTTSATKIVILVAGPILAFFWFALVATLLAKPSVRTFYQRSGRWIDRITGSVLAFFGLRLVLTAKQ